MKAWKRKSHTHKSYHEIMEIIESFNKNTIDVGNQFDSLIMPDMQLQDLGGGMEEGDWRVGDGPAVEAVDDV